MSIIYWNVRGAASKSFIRNTKNLIATYKPCVLIIAEPRISGDNANRKIRSLGFQHFVKTDACGFSGGIWILWNDSIGKVTILSIKP